MAIFKPLSEGSHTFCAYLRIPLVELVPALPLEHLPDVVGVHEVCVPPDVVAKHADSGEVDDGPAPVRPLAGDQGGRVSNQPPQGLQGIGEVLQSSDQSTGSSRSTTSGIFQPGEWKR